MVKVEEYEEIRKRYFVDGWSIRKINRELKHCRRTIRKAIVKAEPEPYKLEKARGKPVLGPYQAKIEKLVAKNKELPRKQRYTARKIFLEIKKDGYVGSEGNVRRYVAELKKDQQKGQAYLPLAFDAGEYAQVDWGEAEAVIARKRVTVQFFVMRLNYSRMRFVMAFPFQKQEAFFEGHIQGFRFFGGVPRNVTYDNLKTAVFRILEGKNRQEQTAFTAFRSYYLYESRYCTPGQGHEKGGVENDVGYVRRNFLVPIPEVETYDELNEHLRQACLQDSARRMRGQAQPIAELWEQEKAQLIPLAVSDYRACRSQPVKVNPYSQVVFETNRYSVPVTHAQKQLVLRAYPFRIEILFQEQIIATHLRCFDRETDIFEPLHYLDILVQRPGAFEHAIPMRQWRKEWPEAYEILLSELRERWPDGRGIREFLAILKLHRDHPAQQVKQAIQDAVTLGAIHLDGVKLCLRQQEMPSSLPTTLTLNAHPQLQGIGEQPINLAQYDQFLAGR
ncbi:MAG: IS21 family transposase [Anaerolineae bacterium]|nr:IS21 family transposase [Anaerolineae bacterium]